ncbi:hypothetical protein ABZT03_40400 [Streptomyces sp. NPDC005574]|uniref:hypothetical protein n=1 Tax=Streptomyces sp. NPDC005574 TaxID=3156891 RepID=UPI00339FBEBE
MNTCLVPVNKTIRDGRFDGRSGLTPLWVRWMRLHDIRFVDAPLTWAAIVWYITARGDLRGALS